MSFQARASKLIISALSGIGSLAREMAEVEMITCVGKYGFLFSRDPRLNAKQGEKLGNEFYMLRERGTNAASGGVSE